MYNTAEKGKNGEPKQQQAYAGNLVIQVKV